MKKLITIRALLTMVLLALSASPTWAQDSLEIEDESLPLYSFFRLSNAVPTNGTEDIVAMGIGVGVSHLPKKGQGAGNNIGLRLIWIPDAPANPLKEGSPDVGSAWGPVLDWQLMFSPRRRISVYTSLAFGFVYGKPDQNKMNTCCDGVQVDIDPDKNQVVPIFEGGVGLRILSPKMGNSKMRFFVSPELGYVPGIDAPYGALNFGLM